MEQQPSLPSSTPTAEGPHPCGESPAPLPEVRDWINVDFRPGALKRFEELFTSREKESVLALLASDADKAIRLEEGNGQPLMQLTIFKVHFRFWDLRDAGRLLVDSLHTDNDAPPPPPNRRPLRDAMVSGGVSGVIRWVLGEVFGMLLWMRCHVFAESRDEVTIRLDQHLVQTRDQFIHGSQLLSLAQGLDHPYRTRDICNMAGVRLRSKRLSCQTLGTIGYLGALRYLGLVPDFADLTNRPMAKRDLVEAHASELAPWRIGMPAPNDEQRPVQIDSATTSTRIEDGEVLTTFQVPISRTVDVRAIRRKLGMTQEAFAQVFGLSLASLRNWEQGTRTPERPIALYLRLIEKYPDEVRREVDAMRLASNSDA